MTGTTDTTEARGTTAEAAPRPADGTPGPEPEAASPGAGLVPARAHVPVALLAAHPGNVRQDLSLTPEFLASVAASGVLVPLRVTPAGDGTFRVIDGHRRLAAAVAAGHGQVPADLAPDREGDAAAQFLDMWATGAHQQPLTVLEQADALFSASESGATRTRIRQATGLKPADVRAALAAGGLAMGTRRMIAGAGQMDMAGLALLAEFQDDPEALARLSSAARYGGSLEHAAEELRQEAAARAEGQRLRASLETDGYAIADGLPAGGAYLAGLLHDGERLTRESHAGCPGRGAYFLRWDPTRAEYFCADPDAHGHTRPEPVSRFPGHPGGPGPAGPDEPGPERRLVVEGNRAWRAATEVRRRWLAGSLLGRRAVPREAASFLAAQLLSMPGPLRAGLAAAPGLPLFAELAGQRASQLTEAVGTATPARLTLLALAPVITAWEHAIADVTTWRTDRCAPCPRADAGTYLTFLASTGYHLSGIEHAVASGTPYTGASPDPDADQPPGPDDDAPQPEDRAVRDLDPGNPGPELAASPEAA